jgi:hypothetical protein
MIKLVLRSLALVACLQMPCWASFDFAVTTQSFNGVNGVVRVSVTPIGEAGSPVSIAQIAAPLQFTLAGGMTSFQLTSFSEVTPAFFEAMTQNNTTVALPHVTVNNEKVDLSSSYFPLVSLANGVTTNLYDVGFTLNQGGTMTVALSSTGTNPVGFPEYNLSVSPDGSTFLPGTIFGSSQTFVSAVPEPSSFLFVGLTAVCVGGARWYRRRRIAAA